MDDKGITISMEEYKELLIIKGKYEELKSQQILNTSYKSTRSLDEIMRNSEPYKLTCKEE